MSKIRLKISKSVQLVTLIDHNCHVRATIPCPSETKRHLSEVKNLQIA